MTRIGKILENIPSKRREQRDNLQEYLDEIIMVEHVFYGNLDHTEGPLKYVDTTVIEVGGTGIPFVGYGSAVRSVTTKEGEVLFENSIIPEDYDVRKLQEMVKYVGKSFGDKEAAATLKRHNDWQEEHSRQLDEAATAAQQKLPEILDRGLAVVSAGKEDEWKQFARNNGQDGYSFAVVEGAVASMEALSAGHTPKEAEDAWTGMGLTGFQAGYIAKVVAHFHERGTEFRKYWNALWGVTDTDGTVNPAILNVGADDKEDISGS